MHHYYKILLLISLAMSLAACSDFGEDKGDKGKDKKSKGTEVVSSLHSELQTRVIYGDDDRLDLYQVIDPHLLSWADSTVALIHRSDLDPVGPDHYTIDQTPFARAYGLCASEPFGDQPTVAFCSGFLVGPNLIATAGHCLRTSLDCSSVRFAFGYAVRAAGQNPSTILKKDVYSCTRIVASEINSRGADFALVELDRPVTDRTPLRIRRTGAVSVGEPLVVIGHPAGLPVKVAGGAHVRQLENDYFIANLDTFGGNSGSAVLNLLTGEVEGILVRGEVDFVTRNGCRVSNQCANSGCRGEDVTNIGAVLPYIPE